MVKEKGDGERERGRVHEAKGGNKSAVVFFKRSRNLCTRKRGQWDSIKKGRVEVTLFFFLCVWYQWNHHAGVRQEKRGTFYADDSSLIFPG